LPKLTKPYFAASVAVLSTLAIIAEIISDLFPLRVPWGMKLDFVGVIWVLAFFLYGLSHALCVSIITTIFILGYSPTAFVGAAMKFIATVPMFLIPAAFRYLPIFSERASKVFNSILVITAVGTLAILVRVIACSVANYYWAIPLFLGMPSEVVLQKMFGNSIWAFIAFVAGMNVFQGVVDMVVPWFLVFKGRLGRYFGTW